MEKIIEIGNKSVKLNNNIAWAMEYRDQFGKDIVPALLPVLASLIEGVSGVIADSGEEITVASVAESLEGRAMDVMLPLFQMELVDTVVNVTWAMAKAADEHIEPPKRWVRQFDEFPLDVVVPEVYDLVIKGFVSSKNLERLRTLGESLKSLRPSLSTTSFSPQLSED